MTGIVSQTAFLTLVIYVKDRLKTLLQDRRRLVLIIFLTFAALWAQFTFIGFFLQSRIGCHVTVILSTISDQAARVTVSGLLLWTFVTTASSRTEQFALRGLIGLRAVQGGVFSGFRTSQFSPLCVAESRILPLAIATIAFDATIVCFLVFCIHQRGFLGDPNGARRQNVQPEGFALALVTLGFFVWSSMSIPSQLGQSGMTLFSRITIPSIGLLFLLGENPQFASITTRLLTISKLKASIIAASGSLLPAKGARAAPLETPTMARRPGSPELVGSPLDYREINPRGLLRVVNPSSRTDTMQSIASLAKSGNSVGEQVSGPAPYQTRAGDRERDSGSIFRSIIGAPLSEAEIVITGESRLPVPPKQAPFSKNVSEAASSPLKASKRTKGFRSDSLSSPRKKISGPVAITGPVPGLKTIDLAEAAELQRRKQLQQASRDHHLEAGLTTATGETLDSPSLTPAETLQKRVGVMRKEDSISKPPVPLGSRLNESASSFSTSAVSGSIRLKGSEEMRRRSPNIRRTSEHSVEKLGRATATVSGSPDRTGLTQHSAGLAPTTPSLAIIHKNPAAAKSGLIVASSLLHTPLTADIVWGFPSPTGFTPSTISIMDRKRPKVSRDIDRTIFPRRKSHESLRLLTRFTQQLEVGDPLKPHQQSAFPTVAAKLEPLIPSGAEISTGIEHRFPAPPSSAPLPLPSLTEVSTQQVPSVVSNQTRSTGREAAGNSETPSPTRISQVTTPQGPSVNGGEASRSSSQHGDTTPPSQASSQTPTGIPRGIYEKESKSPHDMEKTDSETERRSSTIEPTTGEDNDALSGSEDDFEMEIPIQLGYDVHPSRSLALPKEWHYRVGDTTPLFSERRRQKGSKAMPPPVPLLLQSVGRHAKVVTRAQVGLAVGRGKNKTKGKPETLKSTNREPSASVGGDKTYSGLFRGRASLLETIERELNLKERDWQDSLSGEPSTSSTGHDLSGSPSSSSRNSPNRKRLTNSSLKHRSFNLPTSTGISENPRVSVSQRHLAEAQDDYLESAPALLNRNFLTIDNFRVQTSPTPPESERTTSDIDVETDIVPDRGDRVPSKTGSDSHLSPAAPAVNARLWRRSFRQHAAPTALLWEAPPPMGKFISKEVKPTGMALKPMKHRQGAPLRIISSQLWEKPEPKQSQPVGLWGQGFDRPKSETPQRAVQKPQRKSKRFTFLPDIVENPTPIPGKDGALGIFQGPWGPTDSAWPPMLRVSSATASEKERLPESDHSANPSLFSGYDGASRSGSIDDSTIWELGALLDSHSIPSRDSLFPFKGIIIEDYDAEDDEDTDFDIYGDVYDAETYNEMEDVE